MKTRFLRLTFVLVLLIALVPSVALAQDHGDGGTTVAASESREWSDVREVVVWSLVAIAGGCVVLGVLYLFKRSLGGFPENPSWVAPISIMPASELPGDDAGHGDAHGSHGTHAAAH